MQQLGEAEDRREHIVEVVRDAAGELADGLQLLGLPQLRFELALLGDVAADRQDQRFAADVDLVLENSISTRAVRPRDLGPCGSSARRSIGVIATGTNSRMCTADQLLARPAGESPPTAD